MEQWAIYVKVGCCMLLWEFGKNEHSDFRLGNYGKLFNDHISDHGILNGQSNLGWLFAEVKAETSPNFRSAVGLES